jgi:hypothetical protein
VSALILVSPGFEDLKLLLHCIMFGKLVLDFSHFEHFELLFEGDFLFGSAPLGSRLQHICADALRTIKIEINNLKFWESYLKPSI